MNQSIRCQCGALTGELRQKGPALRAVCYCRYCQAYAYHLGMPQSVLDALGGTEVVATQARYVSLDKGAEHLACLSLSPNGLLRWYARCCNTPIANTPRNRRLAYVGLVHTALEKPLKDFLAAAPMHVNTKCAAGTPPPLTLRQKATLLFFLSKFLPLRLTGAWRQTPFFRASGATVVDVQVLSKAERDLAQGQCRV